LKAELLLVTFVENGRIESGACSEPLHVLSIAVRIPFELGERQVMAFKSF
jgi:hypothetical protein